MGKQSWRQMINHKGSRKEKVKIPRIHFNTTNATVHKTRFESPERLFCIAYTNNEKHMSSYRRKEEKKTRALFTAQAVGCNGSYLSFLRRQVLRSLLQPQRQQLWQQSPSLCLIFSSSSMSPS